MNRVDFLQAQLVNATDWRLDYHSAKYLQLGQVAFTTIPYIVKHDQEHRPDLVALAVYGDPSLWWVITQFNGMINALKETVMGLEIRIPDFSEVDTYFKNTIQASNSQSQTVEI